MFDSLDDQMKKDEREAVSNKERFMRYALVAVISIGLFGGLIMAVRMLEG